MPEIITSDPELNALTGIHLWHAGMSNCSQRVRLVLEEKGLAWTSHLIDLGAFEHATPAYQRIHPKGLVPALIHDGRTIIDSNDITAYLDATFPRPSFSAQDEAAAGELLAMTGDMQLCLRTLSHEFLLGDMRRYDRATLERFERDHPNSEFAQFLRKFATEGFSAAQLIECARLLAGALDRLDEQLGRYPWLGGDHISLVDFAWLPNIHRLALFDFPLAPRAYLSRWFDHMRARPSYAAALSAYETAVPDVDGGTRRRREDVFNEIGRAE